MAITDQMASSKTTSSMDFDIISYYTNLLASDPATTPPIAAIESLIALLSSSPLQTISETLTLLEVASAELLRSQPNPIPISAGTELFQRYLITSFNQTPTHGHSGSDFTALRTQLISNSKLFVARTKQARNKIARYALPLLGDGESDGRATGNVTVITYGSSRVVREVLAHAAEKGRYFNVIHVLPSPSSHVPSNKQLDKLREAGIPLAVVPLASLSYTLASLPTTKETRGSSTFFLLGTSAVLENGATVSDMGSYLVSEIANAHQIPLYIATESYKFVRQYPAAYGASDLARMGTTQNVLRFTTKADLKSQQEAIMMSGQETVDITPPSLISGLITENGIMTTNAVAEELIKLWF